VPVAGCYRSTYWRQAYSAVKQDRTLWSPKLV
jgi:hypothetical protein